MWVNKNFELNGSILKGKHNELASNEWKLGEKR